MSGFQQVRRDQAFTVLSRLKTNPARPHGRASLCHCGLDALKDCRFAEDTARLEQVLDLKHQLVHRRVFVGALEQCGAELQRVVQICRALTLGEWIAKVGDDSGGPGSIDNGLSLRQKFAGQRVDPCTVLRGRIQQIEQEASLFGGDDHSLAIDWIEAADGVAEGG